MSLSYIKSTLQLLLTFPTSIVAFQLHSFLFHVGFSNLKLSNSFFPSHFSKYTYPRVPPGRGPGRGRPRTRTSRIRSRTGTRTSEDHDFREFWDEDGQDEDQDGDEDVRGRGFLRIFWTRTARTRTGTGTRTSEDVNFRKFPGRPRTRTARTSTSCGGLVGMLIYHSCKKVSATIFASDTF